MMIIMAMTRTLAEAAGLMERTLLIDVVDLYTVGEPVTEGYDVYRQATLVSADVASLVQTTVLANAVESQVSNTYSIKLAAGTAVEAGMAVKVTSCRAEPGLVGKHLLIDKVSENGLALIRKAVATDFHSVNQQGKGDVRWP